MNGVKRTVSGFLARQGAGFIENRKAFTKRLARAAERGVIKRWPAKGSRYSRDRWLYEEDDLRRFALQFRARVRSPRACRPAAACKAVRAVPEPVPEPVPAASPEPGFDPLLREVEPAELDAELWDLTDVPAAEPVQVPALCGQGCRCCCRGWGFLLLCLLLALAAAACVCVFTGGF